MDLEEVDLAWWVTVPNFGEELGKLIFDSFDQGCVCVSPPVQKELHIV